MIVLQKLVAAVFVVLQHSIAEEPAFLLQLSDVSVAATNGTIVFNCKIQADYLLWFVNDIWLNHDSLPMLIQKGFLFEQLKYEDDNIVIGRVSVNVSARNLNNTVLSCRATCNNSISVISSNATIHVVGIPPAPNPTFFVFNASTVGIEWDAPFTWPDFPIINYKVQVINVANNRSLASEILSPEIFSYKITDKEPPHCTDVVFLIMAKNKIGESVFGQAIGQFPAAPKKFKMEAPKSILVTKAHGTPSLNFTFEFPILCAYSDANYSVTIYDKAGGIIVTDGPHFMSWQESGTCLSQKINDPELTVNGLYTAAIKVETLVGQSFAKFHFNTCISCPDDNTLLIIGSGVAGGLTLCCVIIALLTGMLLLLYRSCTNGKSNIQSSSGSEDCNSQNAGGDYEEISKYYVEREEGYVSVTASEKVTESVEPAHYDMESPVHEDTYTVMKSAGTVNAQIRNGHGARTVF